MPLAVVAGVGTSTPKLWFVHADHLERPIKVADDTKAVVWDAVYRPFGEVHSITGTASNNLRFPGQHFAPPITLLRACPVPLGATSAVQHASWPIITAQPRPFSSIVADPMPSLGNEAVRIPR
jgi:hypothetical protein